jgi:hypothetical protein
MIWVIAPGMVPIDCLQVLLQCCTIMDSRCISTLARSHPPSSHNDCLQVRLQTHVITAANWIAVFTGSPPRSTCPNSVNDNIQLPLWDHLIPVSQCIFQLTVLEWPACGSTNLFDQGLQVYLWAHSIVIFRCIWTCSQAPPAASPATPCINSVASINIEALIHR